MWPQIIFFYTRVMYTSVGTTVALHMYLQNQNVPVFGPQLYEGTSQVYIYVLRVTHQSATAAAVVELSPVLVPFVFQICFPFIFMSPTSLFSHLFSYFSPEILIYPISFYSDFLRPFMNDVECYDASLLLVEA